MGKKNGKRFLELADDLITDIISRVPEKDLTRFKCVSKSWRSLVNTDHDSYLSQLRSQRTVLLGRPFLIIEKKESFSSGSVYYNYWLELDSIEDGNPNPREIHNPFDHDDDSPRRDTRVIASCEGLLVLEQPHSNKMAVLNPTTKKHHAVPPNPAGDDNVRFMGFGCDRVQGCYKLVTRITPKSGDDRVLELVIYNVNNGTWKKSEFEGLDDHYYERYSLVGCVDGALYWRLLFRVKKILCFLLAEEEFHYVDLPDFGNVVVFEDRLCLARNHPWTELWLMECDHKRSSYHRRWIKFLLISDSGVPADRVPICFSACRNKILFENKMLFERANRQLMWYDLKRNEFRELVIEFGRHGTIKVPSCVPSLVGI